MAKSSKVEDYWRQNNIENLFKELTQILVRRMPSDPAIAIVEHLQKKFPKSFKTSTDNIGMVPKPLANSVQLQSMTSPHSDIQNESLSDFQIGRRSSNQSIVSGIETIPAMGSAFTDLFKQNASNSSQAPELNIRNIVFANRLTQQAVRMGKDIRSDRDILEEEVIKPTKTKSTTSTTTDISVDSSSQDLHDTQTHDEPSVRQIIKYKQDIRTENNRRLHRENLAELAKQQREKEHFFQSDLSTKPEEIQQQKVDNNESSIQVVPAETSDNKLSQRPIVQSKEEEEILNDENIFRSKTIRQRGRQRNKLPISNSNTPYIQGRHMTDVRSTMRRDHGNLICKVCGNVMNDEENQVSAAPTARSFEPQQSARSVETSSVAIDDWFEGASNASSSRHLSPFAPDDVTPLPTVLNTFRRNLFQPINDNNTDTIDHRPPVQPLITVAGDETKSKRTDSPHMSESGVFARSSETKIRRPSSSRSIPSPVIKKHQPDTAAVTSHQISKTIAHSSPPRSIPPSTTTMPVTNERRMSGWSVREHSPDDSDGN